MPLLRKLRQECFLEFKASLGHRIRLCFKEPENNGVSATVVDRATLPDKQCERCPEVSWMRKISD